MNNMKFYFWFFLVLTFFLFENIFSNAYGDSENNISIRDQNMIVEEYISGLKFPVMIDFIDNDILIIEKEKGTVRIVKNDILLDEPILKLDVSKTIEEGLVGIFVQNNDVYLHYTTNDDNNLTSNWFVKYSWDGKKLINPVELLSFHNGNGMHNSGIMIANDEGKIFGGIGDTGIVGKFQNEISSELNKTGTIISLHDPDEIYAVGIRNSYGLDFDPKTGILWDTENGPDAFDEINLVEKNFNSGWNKIQGPITENQQTPKLDGYVYSDPEFSWERPIGVTAIHFMNSDFFPSYEDSVLVGSFHDGTLYKFQLNENRNGFQFQNNDLQDLVLNPNDDPTEIIFGTGFLGITDIKKGPDGLIYIVSVGDGKIYRLYPSDLSIQTNSVCNNLKQEKLFECDFSQKIFLNQDFSHKDFHFSDFSNSNLKNINFDNADLSGVNFDGAQLYDISFSNSKLNSVFFKNAQLHNVNFDKSTLISSDFSNSNLKNTQFHTSNLERSIFKNSNIENPIFISSNLKSADLSYLKLNNANFENSDLTYTNLSYTDLETSNFVKTKLYKTQLNNSDIENSNFFMSDIYESNFSNANLNNSNFESSRLSNANFSNANLSQANLLDIYPINSNFDRSDLTDSKINTCLEHDLFSRMINKILRTLQNSNLSFLNTTLVNLCN